MQARTHATPHPDIAALVAGLEPAQRVAVLADEPVVCVLAGAGTGKTKVLTLRAARRVLDRSAYPNHVLVCTFSRKAAEELRHRLWSLGVGREVQAGTFHRTALRLLTHHGRDRGHAAPVIVADRRPLLADLLDGAAGPARRRETSSVGTRGAWGREARHGTGPRRGVARLDAEIGWAKSQLVGPPGYEEAATRASRRPGIPVATVAELYARYEQAQRRRGALDLDDLLWHAGDLLEQEPAFARAMRWWHRHLFVDEMQDLNEAQYRLLRLLVGDEPDLFVVGDPNQSVYGWNGADPKLLERVTEEFAGTRVVRLETNHRCAGPVVRIAAAALGTEGALPEVRRDGPVPAVARFGNDVEEARWVARRAWLAHRPGRRWSSIAILARTNAQLTRIAQALDAERVPYRLAGAELGPASDVRGTGDGDAGDAGDAIGDAAGGAAGGARAPIPRVVTGDRAAAARGDDDAVTVSTFHRAKGLQWRTVFVVGMSDGLVPLITARSSGAKAEERRLLYVALTRAEEELTCTWALRAGEATCSDDVAERRASPWLGAVERAVGELLEGDAVASPARAAQHIATLRDLLPPKTRTDHVR